jgi:uncharacterized protein YqgV (UPF0045/DUF77 family)
MIIQAEVALYPLKTDSVGKTIESFIERLKAHDLAVKPGPMSTQIKGECAKVFAALAESLAEVARQHQAVLIAKFSNACPLEGPPKENETDVGQSV